MVATIKSIMDRVKLPGEQLKDFRAMWESLSEKDKNDLRQWTEEDMNAA
jgi:hypothetical protein